MWLNDTDAIRMGDDVFSGVLACGGTGAGKTTIMSILMAALMAWGCGMLLLTAKRDDFEMICRLAEETGRLDDIREFAPGKGCFDFLTHELLSDGGGVQTASQMMQDLVDLAARAASMNSSEPFWPMAAARQIRMAITAIWHAYGKCSVEDVYRFVTSLPNTPEQRDSAEWKAGFCCQTLGAALRKYPEGQEDPDVLMAFDYVMNEWPRLSDRTGGCISAYTMNVLEKFMAGTVRPLVNGQTTLSPLDVLDGRIAVVNTPALVYREPGQFLQATWKLSTISAALRRDLSQNPRPVVIWADEAQLHAVPSVDSMTQAVARSHRLINVAITQNLPLLVSALGKREEAESWIANLTTKFLFANSDKETNEYFSELLGHSKHLFLGGSSGGNQQYDPISEWMGTAQPQASASFNEHWHPDVPPETFAGPRMRKGGEANGFMVDFYVHQAGRRFSNGKSWIKACARQKI